MKSKKQNDRPKSKAINKNVNVNRLISQNKIWRLSEWIKNKMQQNTICFYIQICYIQMFLKKIVGIYTIQS